MFRRSDTRTQHSDCHDVDLTCLRLLNTWIFMSLNLLGKKQFHVETFPSEKICRANVDGVTNSKLALESKHQTWWHYSMCSDKGVGCFVKVTLRSCETILIAFLPMKGPCASANAKCFMQHASCTCICELLDFVLRAKMRKAKCIQWQYERMQTSMFDTDQSWTKLYIHFPILCRCI